MDHKRVQYKYSTLFVFELVIAIATQSDALTCSLGRCIKKIPKPGSTCTFLGEPGVVDSPVDSRSFPICYLPTYPPG